MLLELRKAVLSSVADLEVPCGKRIYISRKYGRIMSNEAELLPGLKDRGFEIVNLEEHSIAQQVKIFSQAEVITGPHGAGHANILWAKPGSCLFEVFHPAWKHPCYSILSSLIGASYHYMVSEGISYKGHWNSRSRAGISLHVTAPPDLFFKTLDKVMELKS
jgi:capsular polysaccharide biosynthesis protein